MDGEFSFGRNGGGLEKFLSDVSCNSVIATIKQAEKPGRPLGSDKFPAELGQALGRELVKQKPGPRPR